MSTLAFLQADAPGLTASLPKAELTCAPAHEGVFAEIVSFETLIGERRAWADLAGRGLEPNAFLEPAFAIPLFENCREKRPPAFLLAWTGNQTQSRERLIGLLPLSLPARPFGLVARAAEHKHAPLGTPLLDRTSAAAALRQMLDLLQKRYPRLGGLMLPALPIEGPTYRLLCSFIGDAHTQPYLFREYRRAALSRTEESLSTTALSAKKRKQYRRQKRRLSETGAVAYNTVSDPVEVSFAANAFLALESKGWKGARKTAFLASATEAAFFRDMTRTMAEGGKCRIDSLQLDGKPVAMGIVLMSGDRAFYWKTAYDESFAALSPGVQLTLELTQTQLGDGSVTLTDSCAISNHPMIDHIWKDRITMADVLLPIHRNDRLSFKIGVWQENAYRSLRGTAKSLLKRLLRRR